MDWGDGIVEGIDKGLKAWHVIVFVVIALGLGALTGLSTGPEVTDRAGVEILDMRLSGYDYAEVEELLTGLGEDGRSYYATSYLIPDTLFAIFLFLGVGSLLAFLTRPGHRFSVPLNEMVRLVILALPFAGMAMEIMENLSLWIILGSGTEPASGVVAAASLFTGIKWLAYAGTLAALIATVIVAVIRGSTSQTATA